MPIARPITVDEMVTYLESHFSSALDTVEKKSDKKDFTRELGRIKRDLRNLVAKIFKTMHAPRITSQIQFEDFFRKLGQDLTRSIDQLGKEYRAKVEAMTVKRAIDGCRQEVARVYNVQPDPPPDANHRDSKSKAAQAERPPEAEAAADTLLAHSPSLSDLPPEDRAKAIISRIDGLTCLLFNDFLQLLTVSEAAKIFSIRLSQEQVKELCQLHFQLTRTAKKTITSILENPEAQFEDLKKALIDALRILSIGGIHLPTETKDLFKSEVVLMVVSYIELEQTMESFMRSFQPEPLAEETLRETVLSALIPNKMKAAVGHGGEKVPVSEEETDFAKALERLDSRPNKEIASHIAQRINETFHAGLKLRTPDEVAAWLEPTAAPMPAAQAPPLPPSLVEEVQPPIPRVVEAFFDAEKGADEAEERPSPAALTELVGLTLKDLDLMVDNVTAAAERLGFMRSMLQMREGFIKVVQRYCAMRNPDRSEIDRLSNGLDEARQWLEKEMPPHHLSLTLLNNQKTELAMLINRTKQEGFGEVESDEELAQIDMKLREFLDAVSQVENFLKTIAEYRTKIQEVSDQIGVLLREIQRADAYFAQKIFDETFGADPRVIVGKENVLLFSKSEGTEEKLRGLEGKARDLASKMEEFEKRSKGGALQYKTLAEPAVTLVSDLIKARKRSLTPRLVPVVMEEAAPEPTAAEPAKTSTNPEILKDWTPDDIKIQSLQLLDAWVKSFEYQYGVQPWLIVEALNIFTSGRKPLTREALEKALDEVAEFREKPDRPALSERRSSRQLVIRWRQGGHRPFYVITAVGVGYIQKLPPSEKFSDAKRASVCEFNKGRKEATRVGGPDEFKKFLDKYAKSAVRV